MSGLIDHHIDELLQTFKTVRPPVDPVVLRDLYDRKDYASMLGWIKKSMQLDLRVGLRIVNSSEYSPPMWVEIPSQMPLFGSAEFRRMRVIVNARRDVLETKPFRWVVAGFAHELSHVVLFSLGHTLKDDEKAVDLTAMILGYPSFIANTEVRRTEGFFLSFLIAIVLAPLGLFFWRGTRTTTQRLGYLTTHEAKFAKRRLAKLGRSP